MAEVVSVKALDARWEVYKAILREKGQPEAQRYYREEVWPLVREAWREHPRVPEGMPSFAASIHTLGRSPEATVLAILGTRAARVYVLYTEDSAVELERVRAETRHERIFPVEVPRNDPAVLYAEVRRILERYPEDNLALDVTGGTKAMTAGLAAVGFFLEDALSRNVWIVYVDNEVYDPEVRRPRAGSERLIRLPNPHRVLGDLKESRAKALYGAGNYARAAEVFHELHKETADQRFLPYASLCRMYAAWYAFNARPSSSSSSSPGSISTPCKRTARPCTDRWRASRASRRCRKRAWTRGPTPRRRRPARPASRRSPRTARGF